MTIPLLALPQTPAEGAIRFAIGRGDEIGYPHIYADDWRIRRSLNGYCLIIGEGQPPDPLASIERHAAVDRAALARLGIGEPLFVVVGEFIGAKKRHVLLLTISHGNAYVTSEQSLLAVSLACDAPPGRSEYDTMT